MTRLTVLCVTLALSAPSTGRTSDGAAVPLARVPETVSAAPCESLRSVLAGVTSATPTLAGPFQPLSATGDAAARAIEIAQPFCRVALVLRPSSDSEIHVELWLPDAGWNGKFQAVGNGAFNGAINHSAMAAALRRGYAVASTDTGHAGGGAAWALGHPEKVIDFGWRAVHEMVVASKRMVTAYYQAPLRYSYWNGCSAGGRQALKAVQRFPGTSTASLPAPPGSIGRDGERRQTGSPKCSRPTPQRG